MHFTEAGAIFTFIVPTLIISLSVFENRPQLLKAWLALLVVILTAGRTPNRPLIPYVNFIFPSYLWFMTTGLLLPNPLIAFGCMYVFFAAKVGICMSVCFHRYAAHQAFKCGSLMRGLICTLGCLANQGGPIWWASNHRCHHRYCDQERDPHSAVLDGDTRAFAFFVANEYKWVVEDFAPRHIDTLVVRMIDTFAIVPVIGELLLGYWMGGMTGLWIAAVSAQQSQALSLWFNIVNHPDHKHEDDAAAEKAGKFGGANAVCVAADKYMFKDTPNILFSFLNLNLFIAALAGEDGHGHHHQYAQLAQRPGLDLPYRLFVYPLRRFGLIYDAKLLSDIAPAGLWAQKSAEKASEKPLPSTEVASG